MKTKTTNSAGDELVVDYRTGTEGCKHDPYGWTEYIAVVHPGKTVVLRVGALGYTRLTVNGRKVGEAFGAYESPDSMRLVHLFTSHCGMDPSEIDVLFEDEYYAFTDPMGSPEA